MPIEHLSSVPHLTTALSGPLLHLERHLLDHQAAIESWLREQWRQTPAPFYTSVDLRNAGYKLAPVDTNLFPAGFNNLSPTLLPLAIHATQTALERYCPGACRVLILPERHTRNAFYLESLATLRDTIVRAGYETRVGNLDPEVGQAVTLKTATGREIMLEPLRRDGDRLRLADYDPCLILLNNDLSGGRPPQLEGLEQTVLPPLALGWSDRRKSAHFVHYQQVACEFADLVGIDPWLIDPMFRNCGEIDFMQREGEECLAKNAGVLLDALRVKYDEYGIDMSPFIIVKADAGTYGMGVMSVQSVDEVRSLNRKQRTSMAKSKEGRQVTQVILQEGVPTSETWGADAAVAEPVVYMIDHYVIGGFYRVHKGRGPRENLNAPGMHFEPLAFADACVNPDPRRAPDAEPNRFYAYGVIGRLALVAAAREQAEHAPPIPSA